MILSALSLRACGPMFLSLALAMLAASPRAYAQSRDYNPVRRTAATQEQAAPVESKTAQPKTAQPKAAPAPRTAQAETWSPPATSGPSGQWKSMRQPGPVQLPAPRYIPSHANMQPAGPGAPGAIIEQATPEELPPDIAPGNWQQGPVWQDGSHGAGPHCGDHCGGECSDGCCQGERGFGLCGGDCGGCGNCLGNWWPQCWQLFAGVHGFKGPPDRGNNGNFGFHEGINLSNMIKPACGIGYQIGGQWVHSNLDGYNTVGTTTDDRSQSFFTAGLFRRACGPGLQGGVVWDLLHDDYYVDMTLSQIRGELSFVGYRCHEIGFMFAASVEDDSDLVGTVEDVWDPTDQYAFFYRHPLGCGGGAFRVWAGFTGNSDGLLGGDVSVPLTQRLSLATNFNYLSPDEEDTAAISEEAWALGINLVWTPGRAGRCAPCTPLFNVADNASFLVDRRQLTPVTAQ